MSCKGARKEGNKDRLISDIVKIKKNGEDFSIKQ